MHFLNAMMYIAVTFSSLFQQYPGMEWNKKSILNVERPVEFPGIVLQPGIYVIRLREGGERRSFVEILSENEAQVIGSVLAVPDHRVRPGDNSEFTYHGVQRRGPRPVQSWYFSGDLVGLEFVYPRRRALEIAKNCDGHVMASNGMKDTAIVAVTPNGKEIVIDEQPTQTARTKPQ